MGPRYATVFLFALLDAGPHRRHNSKLCRSRPATHGTFSWPSALPCPFNKRIGILQRPPGMPCQEKNEPRTSDAGEPRLSAERKTHTHPSRNRAAAGGAESLCCDREGKRVSQWPGLLCSAESARGREGRGAAAFPVRGIRRLGNKPATRQDHQSSIAATGSPVVPPPQALHPFWATRIKCRPKRYEKRPKWLWTWIGLQLRGVQATRAKRLVEPEDTGTFCICFERGVFLELKKRGNVPFRNEG